MDPALKVIFDELRRAADEIDKSADAHRTGGARAWRKAVFETLAAIATRLPPAPKS